MTTTVKGVNTVQELSKKIKDGCEIKKIREKQMTLRYNNKDFIVKQSAVKNEFVVNLAIPAGLYILGAIVGIILSFVTGLTGLIPMFLFILVPLFIISEAYKAANKSELDRFVAFIGGKAANKEKEEPAVEEPAGLQNDDITQRVIAVVRKTLSLTEVSISIDENASLHNLGADLLDYIEFELGVEKEFGIVFPKNANEIVGRATAALFKVNSNLNEVNFAGSDIGTLRLYIDAVKELLNPDTGDSNVAANPKNDKDGTSVSDDDFLSQGDNLKEQGDYDNAIKAYLSALETNPKNALAQYKIAGCLFNKANGRFVAEDWLKFLDAAQKAVDLRNYASEFNIFGPMAVACFMLGKWKDGFTYCQKADEIENDRSERVAIPLTNIHYQLKHYAKRSILDKINEEKENGNNPDVLQFKAEIMNNVELNILDVYELLKQELTIDAVKQTGLFDEVLELLKDIEALVQPFLKKERNDFSTDILQETREAAERGEVYAQKLLGFHYHSIGDYENAKKWLTKAAIQGDLESKILLRNTR
jgi:acyl carrier protein